MRVLLVLVVLGAVLSTMALSACTGVTVRGEGEIVVEAREVDEFDEVEVCCGMRLQVTQGDEYSLEIEAQESVLADIRSEVSGKRLVVDIDNWPLGMVSVEGPINVYVTAPEFAALSSSGGGRIEAGDIDAQSLELELSGGGHMVIASLEADELAVALSGGSEADLAGQVDTQEVDSSGGGKYNAADLRSADARLNVSGGGRAQVWATDKLDVNASGGSKVDYYGNPAVTSDTSGGSEVRKAGDR